MLSLFGVNVREPLSPCVFVYPIDSYQVLVGKCFVMFSSAPNWSSLLMYVRTKEIPVGYRCAITRHELVNKVLLPF